MSCNWEGDLASWKRQINWQRENGEVYPSSIQRKYQGNMKKITGKYQGNTNKITGNYHQGNTKEMQTK